MNVITRFAPSPTGLLHVGNVRTALINWLFARKYNGKFILRLDDTDFDRSEEKFEKAIMRDLRWLGLEWDRLEHQKDRIGRYDEIKLQLVEAGRLYPCYESEEELEVKRKILLAQGKPPVYDRAALALTEKQILDYEREGKRHHFRFKLDYKDVIWDDLVQGQIKMNARSFSDPIVIRGNGTWTYLLCSIIDDIDFNITHVIRGEDHISNTLAQIQFFEALGATPPVFCHLARIASKTEKISKRVGGFDIQTLRDEKEIEAMTINSFLVLTGTSKDVSVSNSLEGLVESFTIDDFHKSAINYDEADLIRLNHKVLAEYDLADVKDRLMVLDMPAMTESLWTIIRGNIHKLSEAKHWYNVCFGEIVAPDLSTADKEFLAKAMEVLPRDSTWDEQTWDNWIAAVKSHTQRKGKDLFMPLRLALTGFDHGPELKFLLPMIGEERTKLRLKVISR
jgi:glutamyl-tRNA synthetase